MSKGRECKRKKRKDDNPKRQAKGRGREYEKEERMGDGVRKK